MDPPLPLHYLLPWRYKPYMFGERLIREREVNIVGLNELFDPEYPDRVSSLHEILMVRDVVVATPIASWVHVPPQEYTSPSLLIEFVGGLSDVVGG